MLRDQRIRARLIQGLLLAAAAAVVLLLVETTTANLRARGIPIGLEFLPLPSRFVISESLLRYRSQDPYYWAIIVGLANSVFISALVVVLSTMLGLLVGIGRLSSNPLVSGTCRLWVEVARNTPPIVLLIFLYSLWWRVLPPVDAAFDPVPGVFLSMRGLMLPSLSVSIPAMVALVLAGAALAALLAAMPALKRWRRAMLLVAGMVAIGALSVSDTSAAVDWPRFERGNYRGGFELTPELTTVVVGLTLYTTGFIAEIVRAGVLSVGRGQWDAALALGLRRGQILRLIVIPQMLRVIMPPLTSQYINVVKNSTLAIAVGYPDFLAIMGTVINKSSHALEGVAIILAGYLAVNLTLSLLLNWYNRRIALVER
ncbi:amino acid ABC transporter permease [Inquilinus sp. Marseille-Q2685]|uniref:amino acid ABC transporter permease n=1 Tax=Inquilinus sp. Marseille-Q2685 TaxID=2866581 RepID=UPI001CE3D228|nr:ABC transporter permease subunit [Inquilinus sp. Marseille-Q2685]